MCVYGLMSGVRLVSWCVGCECRAWVQCVALCACCVRVGVCVLVCACWCVRVGVRVVCGVVFVCSCGLCGVCCVVCVVVCGVVFVVVWHAENLRVCTPCVRSKRSRVYRQHAHMFFERTHGDVLNAHTEGERGGGERKGEAGHRQFSSTEWPT